MKSRLLKSAVGLALLGLVAGGIGAQASPSDGAYFAMKNAPRLSSKDTVTGALELTHPIQVVVTLKLRNEAQLDAFLATPGHGVLNSEQFMAQYSPTRVQAQAVANFLMNQGFRNVTIAPNRLQVTADGTTREAQNAFQTRMLHVRTHDGRDAFANADNVKIPTEISGQVEAVLGLQTVHIGHTFAQVVMTDGLHTDAVTGHNPTNFASIYTDSSHGHRFRGAGRHRRRRQHDQRAEGSRQLHLRQRAAHGHHPNGEYRWDQHRHQRRRGMGPGQPGHRGHNGWRAEDHLLRHPVAVGRQHDGGLQRYRDGQRCEGHQRVHR